MRWNLSSRARELSGADATLLSIPKSGRTWVRVFVSAYFSGKPARPFSIEITDDRREGVPRIIYSHDVFEHRTKANRWDRLRGKYLVPPKQLHRAPVILLARDPRDAFVSYYVQLTRRTHPAPDSIKRMSADALLRHPRFGILSMVEVMNHWLRELRGRDDFSVLRYEDLRADSSSHFQKLLRALGETVIDEPAFTNALKFSSFENMQQLEASGAFGDKILTPRDPDDRQSYKVREGRVGGFVDQLSVGSLEFAERSYLKLHPAFGYSIDAKVE